MDQNEPDRIVERGAWFQKWGRNGAAKKRWVLYDEGLEAIVWRNKQTDKEPLGVLPIAKVQDIVVGVRTPVLEKVAAKKKFQEGHALSVVSSDRTLDLEANTPQERDRWVTALKTRYKKYMQRQSSEGEAALVLPKGLDKKLKIYPDKFRSNHCEMSRTHKKLQAMQALTKTMKGPGSKPTAQGGVAVAPMQ